VDRKITFFNLLGNRAPAEGVILKKGGLRRDVRSSLFSSGREESIEILGGALVPPRVGGTHALPALQMKKRH